MDNQSDTLSLCEFATIRKKTNIYSPSCTEISSTSEVALDHYLWHRVEIYYIKLYYEYQQSIEKNLKSSSSAINGRCTNFI